MGQGGAGALAAWAKQLGRSVRGGWVNEYAIRLDPESESHDQGGEAGGRTGPMTRMDIMIVTVTGLIRTLVAARARTPEGA